MNEVEWADGGNLERMIEQLARFGKAKGKLGQRKMRLFACACCRQRWSLLSDERSRDAILVSERFAEGLVSLEELRKAREAAQAVCDRDQEAPWSLIEYPNRRAAAAARDATLDDHVNAAKLAGQVAENFGWAERLRFRCEFLRDLFGNPFRSFSLDPDWRTPTVLALAIATYDNRILPAGTLDAEFLAVLADAVEEAGCTDSDILGHLRGPGPHVRGCHVLDLLLGKL